MSDAPLQSNTDWNHGMPLRYLDSLIDSLKREPVFDVEGNRLADNEYRLPMSNEAIALAETQGWKRKTIYRKNTKGELAPEIVFENPECT